MNKNEKGYWWVESDGEEYQAEYTLYNHEGEIVADDMQYYPHPVAVEDMQLIAKAVNAYLGLTPAIEDPE